MTLPSTPSNSRIWQGIERRLFQRLACPTKVVVRPRGSTEETNARGHDISAGGLRFRSPVCFKVGQDLDVEVKARSWEGLGPIFQSLHGKIVVRWVRQDDDGYVVAGSFVGIG